MTTNLPESRREFLANSAFGIGTFALAHLLKEDNLLAETTSEEIELGCRFVLAQLSQLRSSGDKTDHELAALTNLCQQLLSSNEFLYGD